MTPPARAMDGRAAASAFNCAITFGSIWICNSRDCVSVTPPGAPIKVSFLVRSVVESGVE